MFKAIMAPTKGSAMENAAIRIALALAKRFDAELHVVRVDAAPPVTETGTVPPVLLITEETAREGRRQRQQQLEEAGAEWSRLGGVEVITALEDGPEGRTLRDYAEKFKIDLIVMASHCRGGVQRLTMGSVTDYLIRNTSVPVLVSKEPEGVTPNVSFPRIVVPLDGSALAEEILPIVADLASKLQSTISLLHVLMPITYSQKAIIQPGLPWWDEDIAQAEAYLADKEAWLTGKGLTVTREIVLSDDVAAAIIDYTIRTRADLVAIATRGVGGMSRLVFGTVADEITRKSPTSTLVVHPKHSPVRDEKSGTPVAKGLMEA